MIGTKLTRKTDGAEFVITAQDGSAFIATPLDFGSPIALGAGELAADFGVAAAEPTQPDEQAGWDALSRANHANATGANRAEAVPPTVEEFFSSIEQEEEGE